MLKSILQKIGIKSKNDRILNEYQALVDKINGFRERFEQLSHEELCGMTEVFRKRIIENAVTRARERLATDERGLRKKLSEIFEEEQGSDFLLVSVNKHHNQVLTRILTTLEKEIHAKTLDLRELTLFEEYDACGNVVHHTQPRHGPFDKVV